MTGVSVDKCRQIWLLVYFLELGLYSNYSHKYMNSGNSPMLKTDTNTDANFSDWELFNQGWASSGHAMQCDL